MKALAPTSSVLNLNPCDLPAEARKLFPYIQSALNCDSMHPAHKVAYILLLYVLMRNPKRGIQNPMRPKDKQQDPSSRQTPSSLLNFPEFIVAHLPKRSQTLLQQKSAFVIWQEYNLYGINHQVRSSLLQWHEQNLPMLVLSYIPTAQDLMHMQANGQRCLCLFEDERSYAGIIGDSKDFFHFLLHDLSHAYHFFQNSILYEQQIEFFRKLSCFVKIPLVESRLSEDPIYREDFEYLMADMNTHPQHAQLYLKAILTKHNQPQLWELWQRSTKGILSPLNA